MEYSETRHSAHGVYSWTLFLRKDSDYFSNINWRFFYNRSKNKIFSTVKHKSEILGSYKKVDHEEFLEPGTRKYKGRL